jgi:hypothetical protein
MPHPIKTENSGRVVFDRYYIGIGDREKGIRSGSIGVLENGTWCYFPTAKEIESRDVGSSILADINPTVVPDFESWWDRQAAEMDDDSPRDIIPLPSGELVFADDGSPVTQIKDIYAYYPSESPMLETALRLFRMAELDRREASQRVAVNVFDPPKEEEVKPVTKAHEMPNLMCHCGRKAKSLAGLRAHQRHCKDDEL